MRSPARHLSLILPPVQPDRYPALETCPYPGCGGTCGTCFGAPAAGDCTCPSGVATTYEFRAKWGSEGGGSRQFTFPSELATSPVGGAVYVVDFLGNRILRFGSDGSYLAKWGGQGSANGEFYSPAHFAVGLDGTVYVGDWSNGRVQAFTEDGEFVTKRGSMGSESGRFTSMGGIAVSPRCAIYVADIDNDRLQKSCRPY